MSWYTEVPNACGRGDDLDFAATKCTQCGRQWCYPNGPPDACEKCGNNDQLADILAALDEYHAALAARKHGGVAADRFVKACERILRRPWQGQQVIATATPDVNQAVESGMPFSLCCVECDAGMDVQSTLQATADGWTDIQADDGPQYNFCGICPDCKSGQ